MFFHAPAAIEQKLKRYSETLGLLNGLMCSMNGKTVWNDASMPKANQHWSNGFRQSYPLSVFIQIVFNRTPEEFLCVLSVSLWVLLEEMKYLGSIHNFTLKGV
jgi:hypothetical protein